MRRAIVVWALGHGQLAVELYGVAGSHHTTTPQTPEGVENGPNCSADAYVDVTMLGSPPRHALWLAVWPITGMLGDHIVDSMNDLYELYIMAKSKMDGY